MSASMQFVRDWQPGSGRLAGRLVIEGIAVVVAALLPTLACSYEVRAQGFLDPLFGKGSSYAFPPAALRPRSAYVPFDSNVSSDPQFTERAGAYRTLCVRHCDGYYWPVSYAVPRTRFYRDAAVCRQSCGTEASLFYHAVKDDPADMVDLTGLGYTALPMAFRYRKSLVEGCKCKPEPWSHSEIDRHRTYAHDRAIDDEMRAETIPAVADASIIDADRRDPITRDATLSPPPAVIPLPPFGDIGRRMRQRYIAGSSSPAMRQFPSGPTETRWRWRAD
jgi:hypothetical protein